LSKFSFQITITEDIKVLEENDSKEEKQIKHSPKEIKEKLEYLKKRKEHMKYKLSHILNIDILYNVKYFMG
jgi:hypothetical protein